MPSIQTGCGMKPKGSSKETMARCCEPKVLPVCLLLRLGHGHEREGEGRSMRETEKNGKEAMSYAEFCSLEG